MKIRAAIGVMEYISTPIVVMGLTLFASSNYTPAHGTVISLIFNYVVIAQLFGFGISGVAYRRVSLSNQSISKLFKTALTLSVLFSISLFIYLVSFPIDLREGGLELGLLIPLMVFSLDVDSFFSTVCRATKNFENTAAVDVFLKVGYLAGIWYLGSDLSFSELIFTGIIMNLTRLAWKMHRLKGILSRKDCDVVSIDSDNDLFGILKSGIQWQLVNFVWVAVNALDKLLLGETQDLNTLNHLFLCLSALQFIYVIPAVASQATMGKKMFSTVGAPLMLMGVIIPILYTLLIDYILNEFTATKRMYEIHYLLAPALAYYIMGCLARKDTEMSIISPGHRVKYWGAAFFVYISAVYLLNGSIEGYMISRLVFSIAFISSLLYVAAFFKKSP
jgi:hypothetical protein